MSQWADYAKDKAGVMFVLMGIFLGALYYVNISEQEDRANCQSQFNQTFAEVVSLRAQSSGERQTAVDAVIMGVGKLVITPPGSAAEQQKAAREYAALFATYAKAVQESDAVRNENPYPPFPTCRVSK